MYPALKYLSVLSGTGMFPRVIRYGWSSHVCDRLSVPFCVLFSEYQRASRALGAALPSYLSGAISMWMLQLFGCGIFPHMGSYQSRLTGHCLHSITGRPGLEKKQATDVQLETGSSLQLPLHLVFSFTRDGEDECAVTIFSQSASAIPFRSNTKLPAKRKGQVSFKTQDDTTEWYVTLSNKCLYRHYNWQISTNTVH